MSINISGDLTNKQHRIIKKNICDILSLKGLFFPNSVEDFKKFGILSHKFIIDNKWIFLTEYGKECLYRICNIIYNNENVQNNLNYNDVFQESLSELKRWFKCELIPDDKKFLQSLESSLLCYMDYYTFICKVDGFLLEDIEKINIGTKEIKLYNNYLLSHTDIESETSDLIEKEYNDSYIIQGIEKGSRDLAQEKFYHNSELSLSILRIYSCAMYREAIQKINLRLLNNPVYTYSYASCLGWSNTNKSLIYTKYFPSTQKLKVDSNFLNKIKSDFLFNEISDLIDKTNKSQLENAILKSIFWIGEAQKEYNKASSWIKLWSSLECFFSISNENILEKNAQGISSLLVYGGYKFERYSDYNKIKQKIKDYYEMRSKVIHRAHYTKIDIRSLDDLSHIVAWIIILMASLSKRGYTKLYQVLEQAERLDKLH